VVAAVLRPPYDGNMSLFSVSAPPEPRLSSLPPELREALLHPTEGEQLFRAMSSIFQTPGSKWQRERWPATVQTVLPKAEALGLIAADGQAMRLTLLGKHVGNTSKEYVNWLNDGRVAKRFLPIPLPLKGKRFLDCGCGSGRFSTAAILQGAETFGIDPQPLYLELLTLLCERESLPIPSLQCAKSEAIPFEDNFFDVVFSRVSLAYCMLDDTFDEWQRVTAPGGVVVLRYVTFSSALKDVLRGDIRPWMLFGLANTVSVQLTGHQFRLRGGGMEDIHCTTFPFLRWVHGAFRKRGFTVEHSNPVIGEVVARKRSDAA
jgi:SAM-dependent methyltransferase